MITGMNSSEDPALEKALMNPLVIRNYLFSLITIFLHIYSPFYDDKLKIICYREGPILILKCLIIVKILDNILSHMDFTTLKTARCVCTAWDDIATPILGRKGRITFSKFKGMAIFNPKLATNVSLCLDSNCDCLLNCRCGSDPMSSPALIMLEVSNHLTELHLWVGSRFNARQHEAPTSRSNWWN